MKKNEKRAIYRFLANLRLMKELKLGRLLRSRLESAQQFAEGLSAETVHLLKDTVYVEGKIRIELMVNCVRTCLCMEGSLVIV
uniref:Protein translocase subunit SecA n=1 Tax=Steinernema glaseri TaxID=37863 RepID=A0A1I7ZAK9_9BILA